MAMIGFTRDNRLGLSAVDKVLFRHHMNYNTVLRTYQTLALLFTLGNVFSVQWRMLSVLEDVQCCGGGGGGI